MTTTTFHAAFPVDYTERKTTSSLFLKFITWCENQQAVRLLWLGVILAAHGCVLTPATLMMVLVSGNHLALFMTAMTAMGMALVTNLAAMPTKVTLPVFFLSIAIDAAVMITCLVNVL